MEVEETDLIYIDIALNYPALQWLIALTADLTVMLYYKQFYKIQLTFKMAKIHKNMILMIIKYIRIWFLFWK